MLAPTATAMRHLLSVCDIVVTDFDVSFNAQKTKCIFFINVSSQQKCPLPIFYVGKNIIQYVDNWPHQEHILQSNKLKCDNDDIKRKFGWINQT